MHGTYEQNKGSIIRWREKNRLLYNQAHKRFYAWKKIRFEFLAILL